MKKLLKIGIIIIGSIIATPIILFLIYYFFGWESNQNIKLYNSIKDADKIVIEVVHGTSEPPTGKPVKQITSPLEVADFISHLQVKKNRLGRTYAHGCYGDYYFVFYKNENIITTITIAHGKELSWWVWESDHKITDDCYKYLYGKFKEMGLDLSPRDK